LSLSSAAAAVSPVANAAKNRSAAGAGPSGRGVHAETADAASRSTAPNVAADATVILVAIVADVRAVTAVPAATHRYKTVTPARLFALTLEWAINASSVR
jgi:hypothetical protein